MFKFDPAVEALITEQFKTQKCDMQTYILMLIGKLTYLHRQHERLEIENEVRGHQEEDSKQLSAKKQKLEYDIEDLEDDISYFIHRLI